MMKSDSVSRLSSIMKRGAQEVWKVDYRGNIKIAALQVNPGARLIDCKNKINFVINRVMEEDTIADYPNNLN